MNYEYLIRRVYNSARNYKNGADADIYRKMERAFIALDRGINITSKEEAEYEYRSTFSNVRYNVAQAIKDGIRHVSKTEDRAALEDILATLTLDFYSKQQLDQIIDRSNDILLSNGLMPG